MTRRITVSPARAGGYAEASRAGSLLAADTLPARAHLIDASSPVPNFRASELLVALWAAFSYDVAFTSDITPAGTVAEYGTWLPDDADRGPGELGRGRGRVVRRARTVQGARRASLGIGTA